MLSDAAAYVAYSLLGLERDSAQAAALIFFIEDSVKIILLLYVMIAFLGFLRTFIPAGRIRTFLSGRRYGLGYLASAAFGALTPFCSCSSIPIFISFLRAGVPLGAAFSFLITSPLINEYLVVLMLAEFGWRITAAYIVFGLVLGVCGGLLAQRLGVERYVVEDMRYSGSDDCGVDEYSGRGGLEKRVRYGLSEASSITGKLWKWVLFGVGVGALIHGYVPQETIEGVLAMTGPFSVPVAVLIGIPLYANCAAIVPIAVVLFQKGVPLGTALAFMMSTAALSLPEAVMLRRAMKLPLIILFFALVASGIVAVGYLFSFLQNII